MELNPRLTSIFNMAEKFCLSIDEDCDSLKVNELNIEKVVNDYYTYLDSWKEHFGCPDGIDRYKVAALTAHYLIKYPVVELKDLDSTIALYRCSNLLFTLAVALSRLDDGGRPFLIGKRIRAEILRLFLLHQNSLAGAADLSPEETHDIVHTFLSSTAVILEGIESRHHDLDSLPL